MAAILLDNGAQDVDVGTPIGIMVEEEADIPAVQKAIADGVGSSTSTKAQAPAPAGEAPTPTTASAIETSTIVSTSGDMSKAEDFFPSVFQLLGNNNLDPKSIKGTGQTLFSICGQHFTTSFHSYPLRTLGKRGMLLKGDVIAAMKNGTAKQLDASSSGSTAPSTSAPAPASSPAATSEAKASGRRSRSYIDIPRFIRNISLWYAAFIVF